MKYKVIIDIEPGGIRSENTFDIIPFLPSVGDTVWMNPSEQEEAYIFSKMEKKDIMTEFRECVVKDKWFDFCSEESLYTVLLTVGVKA